MTTPTSTFTPNSPENSTQEDIAEAMDRAAKFDDVLPDTSRWIIPTAGDPYVCVSRYCAAGFPGLATKGRASAVTCPSCGCCTRLVSQK